VSDSDEDRRELLRRIGTQRASIDAFLRQVRPRSVRLANISIVSSAAAAVFTAGPALGGVSFAEAVQRTLSLSNNSIVWQALCLVAMLVSLVATISMQLSKSQDATAQLSAAEACDTELEGLQTLLELGQLQVRDATDLYIKYIAKIPFVRKTPVSP
jgi:hypothetical protein